MPSLAEATGVVLESVAPLAVEEVPALEAAGRVLAEDLLAPRDFPAWDNSAMDGFAVRAAEVVPPARLPLSAYVPAGAPGGEPLRPGTAARILTGAPLPPGADAVVPFEEAEEREGAVLLRSPVHPGAHVRRRGEDLLAGVRAVRAGTVLGPAEVSYLAACARATAPVFRRARVAILATGDELVPPGEPLSPGKIHDSNSLAVAAAVRLAGGEPLLLGIARDELDSLRELLARGLEADALVTTAGVSMGDRDFVRLALEELGVRQLFWKVDIKPGRPTAFGLRGRTPVFSLPGNPVSTLLTFEQFVRPALLAMMGHRSVLRPVVDAVLEEEVRRKPGRVSLLRVRLERAGSRLRAWSAGDQDTGILRTLLRADGIAILPAEWGDVPRHTAVPVQVLRDGLLEAVA